MFIEIIQIIPRYIKLHFYWICLIVIILYMISVHLETKDRQTGRFTDFEAHQIGAAICSHILFLHLGVSEQIITLLSLFSRNKLP